MLPAGRADVQEAMAGQGQMHMQEGLNQGQFGFGNYAQAYGSYGYDVDWQDQREAEWQQQMQSQIFSRWSVDKFDEWQAYQTQFDAVSRRYGVQGNEPAAPQWNQAADHMSPEDAQMADAYRRQHDMQVISAYSSSAAPKPAQEFEAANLPNQVLSEICAAGFVQPTPIQAQCWPILSAGHDLIGIAKSGSGKTLAFLGPGFVHVLRSGADPQKGPVVLILAPTRELARQIQLEALKFGRSSGILSCAVTGGEPKGDQLEWLKSGCHVIIATPGRLNEFLEQKRVWLGQIGYIVLDEADRMLDMGFEQQIRRIIEECPHGPSRQTLLFSATWPKVVRQLAFDFLRRPMHVHIGEMNTAKANTDVTQHVILLHRFVDKDTALQETLSKHLQKDELAIVFVATKRACQEIARRLQDSGLGVTQIHGDKDQRERDLALRVFMAREQTVLIATDVASRGLDIKGVKLVINYDAANTPEEHVHRIGRTGRAGEKGLSYTFLVKGEGADVKKARAIIEVMRTAGQDISEELRLFAAGNKGGGKAPQAGFKGVSGGCKGGRSFKGKAMGGKGFRSGRGFGSPAPMSYEGGRGVGYQPMNSKGVPFAPA